MLESIIVVVFISMLGIAGASCPNIISREEWNAKESSASDAVIATRPATYIIIHHTKTPKCTNQQDCEAMVKSIQNTQMTYKGHNDIAYNFLIGEDGKVYEGVGWDRSGDLVPSYDSKGIHVGMIGDYTSWLPGIDALNATKDLIYCGVSRGSLYKGYNLVGHEQLDKQEPLDCPGTRLQQEIEQWPNWSQQ